MEENLRLLKPFLRGFPIIVLGMVLAIVIAKKYLSYVEPKYQSHIVIKLADVAEGVPSSNLFKEFDVFANANKIAAEIEVLKSAVLIDKALDKLEFDYNLKRVGKIKTTQLYKNSPFQVNYAFKTDYYIDKVFPLLVNTDSTYILTMSGEPAPLRGKFGAPLELKHGSITINYNYNFIADKPNVDLIGNYELEFKSRESLIKKILKELTVTSAEKDVAILRISYKSHNPQKSADLVNSLAQTYIEDYLATKHRAAQVTVDFLNGQINEIYEKLKLSEDNILKYRDDNQIFNMRQETETELKKLAQLKIQLTNEKLSLEVIEQIKDSITIHTSNFAEIIPHLNTFSDLLSTQLIKNLKDMEMEREKLLIDYTPEDPKVKTIDKHILSIKKHIVESIKNTYVSMQIKYDKLNSDIEEIEKSFLNIPEKERVLTIFEREFNIYQHTYNYLNEKRIEAEILQAAKIAFHRIITPAVASKSPVSPNKGLIVIVSAMLGMFGSIVLIYIVHLLKAKVNDVVTIERNSTIPIALQTPRLKRKVNKAAFFIKQAIHLELKKLADKHFVISLTSYGNGEGRFYHVKHLAHAFEEQGKSVVIITPNIANEHLANLNVINLNEHKNETISIDNISTWLSALKKSYDLVLIDNDPVTEKGRALLFMGVSDVNLFVVDSRITPAKRIAETELLRDEYGLPNVYFILNRMGYNPSIILTAYNSLLNLPKLKRLFWK